MMSATSSPASHLESRVGRRLVGLAVAVCVLAVLPLLAPNDYILSLMVFANIYVVFTLGLNLLFGYAGQMSLGHAAFYGFGAYTSAVLSTRLGLPFLLTLPAAALVAGGLAYLVGRPILKLQVFYLAMATLVVGVVADRVFHEWVDVTKGAMGIVGIPSPRLGPLVVNTPFSYYYLAVILAVVCVVFAFNLVRGDVGRALRTISSDELAAASVGIDVAGFKARVFAISGALAGIAGALYAHFVRFISPESFGLDLSILVVVTAVIGGVHSIWGAVVGALFLTMLPELLRVYGQFNQVIYGLVLFLTLLFLPGGLVSLGDVVTSRLRRGPRRGFDSAKAAGPLDLGAELDASDVRASGPST